MANMLSPAKQKARRTEYMKSLHKSLGKEYHMDGVDTMMHKIDDIYDVEVFVSSGNIGETYDTSYASIYFWRNEDGHQTVRSVRQTPFDAIPSVVDQFVADLQAGVVLLNGPCEDIIFDACMA